MTQHLIIDKQGATGLITLNRASALNALTHPMCAGMAAALAEWVADDAIQQVVLDAVAGRAFCAGGDIRRILEMAENNQDGGAGYFAPEYELNRRIADYPKPIVVIADGITMGGGAGLLMNARHSLVSDRIVFSMPETMIGHFPDVAASHFLRKARGKFGHFLGVCGVRINHHDMVASGLVSGYVKHGDVGAMKAAIIQREAATDLDKLLAGFMQHKVTPDLATAANLAWLDKMFALPRLEDIRTEVAEASHPLAKVVLQALTDHAPLSLKISHRLFASDLDGQVATVASALALDYILATQMARLPDFAEGVRATLIDKDKNPNWQHSSLEEVDDGLVAAMFTQTHETRHAS